MGEGVTVQYFLEAEQALCSPGEEYRTQEGRGLQLHPLGCTSLGRKGLKKQSSSLRRLMVRLLLVEAITSFTVVRTKAMELCWEQAPGLCGQW